uniref:GPI-anchored protein LLG1-like domain-containing protein n=1 Tax=Kalanchoe fedtschenkoi TaxID=63787 RepID=A0A7N0RCW3_KALFE
MELNHKFSLICSSYVFLCFLLVGSSSAAYISDNVFGSHVSAGRSLLQAKKSCSVNFEFLDYSVLINQCKGPRYPANQCCPAFKNFACPYSEEINDLDTDCASTMFSYINLYGKYPPGLFASECREGKEGLDCTNFTSTDSTTDSSGSPLPCSPFALLLSLILGFMALLMI